jgi:hypothetical protein
MLGHTHASVVHFPIAFIYGAALAELLMLLGMGAGNNVGRIGFRTALWYASTSIFSILTGLLCVNLIAPGEGTNILIPTTARQATPPDSFWDVLANMIPSNVFDSAANFDMFGIIVFAISVTRQESHCHNKYGSQPEPKQLRIAPTCMPHIAFTMHAATDLGKPIPCPSQQTRTERAKH